MEEGRRRPMLSHQMSVIKNPPNLRNEKDEEEDHETLTPGSASNRTLFDIIQNEESSSSFAYRGVFPDIGDGNKHNWKSFKDRLRIRRTGAAWNSSARPIPVCDEFSGTSCPRSPPETGIPVPHARSLVRSVSRIGGAGPDLHREEAKVEAAPVRVSLMALLEQTDSQLASVEAEEEEDGEEEEEEGGGEKEYVCCVCMVRHKGAAFIPCGHTFCRMCSRELWVSSGNCPLCNGYILEILHIF